MAKPAITAADAFIALNVDGTKPNLFMALMLPVIWTEAQFTDLLKSSEIEQATKNGSRAA